MEAATDRQDDYVPGDPANIVLGKPDEQSARIHAPQPPKPRTSSHILADIRLRMQELQPLVEEFPRLVEADAAITKALKGLKKVPR